MMETNIIYTGDCLERLKKMRSNSVDCIVTSPPYWGLRDYKVKGQIGLERSYKAYVKKLVEIFNEAHRVLKKKGTLWLNIGDTYATGKIGRDDQQKFYDKTHGYKSKTVDHCRPRAKQKDIKPKDLVGIPWMVALALRNNGWYLRRDIIWHKPNPMPESVKDRPTTAHEYIFLLTKSIKYYYDYKSILEPIAESTLRDKRLTDENYQAPRIDNGYPGSNSRGNGLLKRKSGNKHRKSGTERGCPENTGSNVCGSVPWEGSMRNKRSVWTVTPKPFKDAHFATFPPELIVDCIKAGCPEGGIVLDLFMGAGTTGIVALQLGRKYIGIELNPYYVKMAEKRIHKEYGLFKNA